MTLLRVFISSPGDVAQERAVARRVLARVQAAYGGQLTIEPVLWEQQPLLATETFQTQLARPSDTDVFLAILWARFGTPLPQSIRRADGSRYQSGTEFEIEDAMSAAVAGAGPRILIYRKTAPPNHWYQTPQDALEAGRQRESLDGFLDRLLRDASDGSFAGAFHPFRSAAEFEEMLELHLHRLVRELVPVLAESELPPPAAWRFGSPYLGLQSFELEDAPLFFGRTAATESAVERLLRQSQRGQAFLLLLGMSGSGKSSLAKAGVLPMLMQPGVVDGAAAWRWAVMRPGDGHGDLLLALCVALTTPGALPIAGPPETLAAAARASTEQLLQHLLEALDAPGTQVGTTHLVLVIDQFEEAFRDDLVSFAEREAFVRVIARLAGSGRVWIVATMRSEFYPRCAELPQLVELKEGAGQYDLLPPTAAQVAQMIRGPAAAAGLRFEQDSASGERLDERLRDAMAERSSALPLLEFTLEELYQRRAGDGLLTFAAYHAIGGLEGAIAHRAESVFSVQDVEVQASLSKILDAVVVLHDSEDTPGPRRARLEAFSEPTARRLVEALVDARLLVTDLASDGAAYVGVAHEALFRHWPRVAAWLDANRELLRIRARVSTAAERWQREARSPEYLLAAGKPYIEGAALLQSGRTIEPLEADFIAESGRRVRRNRRIRRAAVAALAVLAVAASVGAVVSVQQARIAGREATTASRTSEFLVSMFAVADPSEARGSKVTARELLDRGAITIRNELRDEPLVRAQLMNTMGSAYAGLGLFDSALRLTAEARDARLKLLGRDDPDTLRSQIAYATVLYLTARYEEASAAFRDAAETAARLYPRGHIDRTRASLGYGDVLIAEDKPEDAERVYRASLGELSRLPGNSALERVKALSGLGSALYFQGRLPEAATSFREAIDLGTQTLGRDHPKVAETVNNLGSLAYQQGEYAQARLLWEQALPMYRQIFGPDHPEVATVLNNLGRLAVLERRFENAESLFGAALEIERRYKDAGHDDLIMPLNSLGLARMGLERYADAERAFAEALEISRQHDHWMRGVVLTGIADLLVRKGDFDAALKQVGDARRALDESFPPEARQVEGWRFELLKSEEGAALDGLGRHAEAEPLVTGSVAALAARFGESSLFATDAMRRVVRHFEAVGDAGEAAKWRTRLASAMQPVDLGQ